MRMKSLLLAGVVIMLLYLAVDSSEVAYFLTAASLVIGIVASYYTIIDHQTRYERKKFHHNRKRNDRNGKK